MLFISIATQRGKFVRLTREDIGERETCRKVRSGNGSNDGCLTLGGKADDQREPQSQPRASTYERPNNSVGRASWAMAPVVVTAKVDRASASILSGILLLVKSSGCC